MTVFIPPSGEADRVGKRSPHERERFNAARNFRPRKPVINGGKEEIVGRT